MFTDFNQGSIFSNSVPTKNDRGYVMPPHADITERQANRVPAAAQGVRNCIAALYEKGRPNDVGLAFRAVCSGQISTDTPALECLQGMKLIDTQGSLTDHGREVKGYVFE